MSKESVCSQGSKCSYMHKQCQDHDTKRMNNAFYQESSNKEEQMKGNQECTQTATSMAPNYISDQAIASALQHEIVNRSDQHSGLPVHFDLKLMLIEGNKLIRYYG